MRKVYCLFLFLVLFSASVPAQKNNDLSLDSSKSQWFRDAKFGMFIHWGLYSILEGSYNGHTLPDTTFRHGKSWYAEWIQKRFEIPGEEYRALAKQFNPVNFDADEWIREAKNAGMKYFAITSKHHDGFALWDTKYSDFNVMNTAYGKDILAQLVNACKKYGLKYGFYYSHWMDWEYPGGALEDWEEIEQPSDAEFQKYWEQKSLPQVKELIEKFDPDFFWFDTWGSEGIHITPERRDELIKLVRTNSDKCLINGRISYSNPGENVDFIEMLDNVYSIEVQEKPWQTPATMNRSFGWHAKDYNWKSSQQMLGYLINCTSRGGNYLLNIGPKADGTFPVPAVRRLREMGAWLYANGESVYGATHINVKVPENSGLCLTQKKEGENNYLYISMTKPIEVVDIPVGSKLTNIINAKILETDQPVSFSQSAEKVLILIPDNVFNDKSIQVIKLEISSLLK